MRAASAWLLYSGIIGYCDFYNNGDMSDVVSNRRAYFADNGIANYIAEIVTIPRAAVEGILTETFAYTELKRLYQVSAGKKQILGDMPSFSVCGDYGLDFVVVDQSGVRTGIEVKTGDNCARSLEYFKEKGVIDRAFHAMPSRGGHGKQFDTIPIYTVGGRFPY